jgi:hypothetical protein
MEVNIDIENDIGTYCDPCIWIDHSTKSGKEGQVYFSAEAIKEGILASFPKYTTSDRIHAIADMAIRSPDPLTFRNLVPISNWYLI